MRKANTTITIRDMKVPMENTIIMNTTRNTMRRVDMLRDINMVTTNQVIKVTMMVITVNHKHKCRLPQKTSILKPPIKFQRKLKHPRSNIRYTYMIPKRRQRVQCRWMVQKSEKWTDDVIAAMKNLFQMCDVDVYLSLLLFFVYYLP